MCVFFRAHSKNIERKLLFTKRELLDYWCAVGCCCNVDLMARYAFLISSVMAAKRKKKQQQHGSGSSSFCRSLIFLSFSAVFTVSYAIGMPYDGSLFIAKSSVQTDRERPSNENVKLRKKSKRKIVCYRIITGGTLLSFFSSSITITNLSKNR